MLRVFVEGGIAVGRATGYSVEAQAGGKVKLTLVIDSGSESVLLLAEAIVAEERNQRIEAEEKRLKRLQEPSRIPQGPDWKGDA